MEENQSVWIDVAQLRLGLFVQLDLGWMEHPFPKGSFRIASEDQICTIRSLGLNQVRYFPAQSDAEVLPLEGQVASLLVGQPEEEGMGLAGSVLSVVAPLPIDEATLFRNQRREKLDAQQRSLQACERRFGEAMRQFRQLAEQASSKPAAAREQAQNLVTGCVNDILSDGESAIRLLSETMGDRSAEHPVNVMVISLLLGKALGLSTAEMNTLGVAALVHDLGKSQLPERMRHVDPGFSDSEIQVYREHVQHSLSAAQRMALTPEVVAAVAQHHEMIDGSGFPAQLHADQLSAAGKILALVNCYDNLCNPARLVNALTPHEALSLIFAQMKPRFDSATLGAFIRMMGVYPPGSVVQLANDGFAIVVSVNSARPLKPRVILHDVTVPREEAMIVDLEDAPALGIRRSIKPSQLPRAALDYLSPRLRVCYYYERAVGVDRPGLRT